MYRGYIYRHWIVNDKGEEKSYIGQTVKTNVRKRWQGNGSGYLQHNLNNKFANAIKKYGWNNFHHDIIGIVEADTKDQLISDLDEWEKYYIDKYDSFYNGYNSTTGGSRGKSVSEESKQKQREKMTGRTHTEESKHKMSESRKGENNPKAKKVICLETKQVFGCAKDASKWCGVKSNSDILKCCKGKRKTCGGYCWMYYSDYLEQQNNSDSKIA